MQADAPVILFDGLCNLCESSVQFIIKRDEKRVFKFASLQGNYAKQLLKTHGIHDYNYDTFILWQAGKIYTHSTAALKVLTQLGGFWKLLYFGWLIPKFIRDLIYSFVAKNRYKWFGKKTVCWIPTPQLKERFLD